MIMPARTATVNQNLESRVAKLEAIVEALHAAFDAMAADRKWLIRVVASLAVDAEQRGVRDEYNPNNGHGRRKDTT